MEKFHAGVMSPAGYTIDPAIVDAFETGLDTADPESNRIPCKVLGYGEISTVLALSVPEFEDLALKRVSIFRTDEELRDYLSIYLEYNRLLDEEIGLNLPAYGYCSTKSPHDRPVLYLIQAKLPAQGICNQRIATMEERQIIEIFLRILDELNKVWSYNNTHAERQVAIDGQLSNWCAPGEEYALSAKTGRPALYYLDTSTPQIRLDGEEQLNGELFLRSAPPVLDWLLKILYMEEVMARYYDPMLVISDLIANFYKEQRPDIIPALIREGNHFLNDNPALSDDRRLNGEAIEAYYERDKSIWRLYMGARRIDRFLRGRVLGMDYPYILPGPVER